MDVYNTLLFVLVTLTSEMPIDRSNRTDSLKRLGYVNRTRVGLQATILLDCSYT